MNHCSGAAGAQGCTRDIVDRPTSRIATRLAAQHSRRAIEDLRARTATVALCQPWVHSMTAICRWFGSQNGAQGRGEPGQEPAPRQYRGPECDDLSSNRHPTLSFCLRMISAQTRSAFVS
jgi:hypothetical protein